MILRGIKKYIPTSHPSLLGGYQDEYEIEISTKR